MLVLFDIDATLIKTNRAGVLAMHDAAKELWKSDFAIDGVEFGGSLDPIIMRRLLERNGLDGHAENVALWRELYGKRLDERLSRPGTGFTLPGVPELLDRLEADGEVTLGLLTGNYPETGEAKLRASGIDPRRFAVKIFASDSPHDPPERKHLPLVAIDRQSHRLGRTVSAREIIIIGDTPNDVHCALANDCWVIAVATGTFSADQLDRRGAHLTLPSLEDTGRVERFIRERRSIVYEHGRR